MSGTETVDGDVVEETELAAEITDNSSPRELIERAEKLLDPLSAGNAYCDIALQRCKEASNWLRKGGL
jgi:hypothetical protein